MAAFGWAILYSRHAQPKIDASLRQMPKSRLPGWMKVEEKYLSRLLAEQDSVKGNIRRARKLVSNHDSAPPHEELVIQ